ncbi:hypothetical protein GMLC_02030 [Geomonas limicola]|uniref:Uncharacterized protein n=1 Tax=Geomonas limicola TaxID=2740186 RepID=A0A6V8N3R9_9BACT|nr:hypothetical protein GMLC_02030 [Geomonas limicola]
MDTNRSETPDPAVIARGLRRIRLRRWALWTVLIIYLPTMWSAQQITRSFQGALPVFFAWVLLLIVATAWSATVRCPRCGNYYHVNGLMLLYLRRCLHCQLPLAADHKKSD